MALKLKFDKVLVKDNTDRLKTAESSIVQQALEIALRVSTENYNGETIASLINQTASTIKIQASHIQLEGIVTANSFFKILADGSIEAVNAKLSGAITATRMVSPSGDAYYGEIGMSAGYVGMGLYDTNYNTSPYFRVAEIKDGSGFNGFNIYDELGQVRLSVRRLSTRLYGPTGNSSILLAPDSVTIFGLNTQQTWG